MKIGLISVLFYSFLTFPEAFIKNGRLAAPSEYLDTIALVRKNKIFCTATLLSSNIVISAKHCIEKKNKDKIFAFQGDTSNLKGKNGRELSRKKRKSKQYVQVLETISIRNNDVALFILKKPLHQNKKISFLSKDHDVFALDEVSFSVAGFGRKKKKCTGRECENAAKTVIDNFLVQKSCLENPYYINLEVDPYHQREKSGRKCRVPGYPNMLIFSSGVTGSGAEQHLLGGDSGAGVYMNRKHSLDTILWGIYRGRLGKMYYKENDMGVNLLLPKLTCALKESLYLKYKKSKSKTRSFLAEIYSQYQKLTSFCTQK